MRVRWGSDGDQIWIRKGSVRSLLACVACKVHAYTGAAGRSSTQTHLVLLLQCGGAQLMDDLQQLHCDMLGVAFANTMQRGEAILRAIRTQAMRDASSAERRGGGLEWGSDEDPMRIR